MSQADTKTRLLDAAEQLFSREGFANTSLRNITAAADANLAAANYHFGSKEALLTAVLERRFHPLNAERQRRLDAVLTEAAAQKRPPRCEELLRAFIEPTICFRQQDQGSREFVKLVGRSLTAADPLVRAQVIALVQPLFVQLHRALCQALPHLPPTQIFTRLFFVMGAMGHCLCFQGVPEIFKTCPDCNPEDDQFMLNSLIAFAKAGLEAPC